MIHRGMALRDFEVAFLAIGGEIRAVRRSGEKRYYHPAIPGRHVTANARRRDVSLALAAFGARAERLAAVTR